jgi:hypothetical protein
LENLSEVKVKAREIVTEVLEATLPHTDRRDLITTVRDEAGQTVLWTRLLQRITILVTRIMCFWRVTGVTAVTLVISIT